MADAKSRYRVENGETCIDVRVNSLEHIFDNRDPAPFRERDLDPDLAEYLIDAVEDLGARGRFRVIFWLGRPCLPGEIEEAFHAHFNNVLDRIRRTRREHRRTGQVALLLAVLLIVALLSIAPFVPRLIPGVVGEGIEEGLVISTWVVMWRPVEVLIYDWIPVWHERKVVTKLLEASIEVRIGSGPGRA